MKFICWVWDWAWEPNLHLVTPNLKGGAFWGRICAISKGSSGYWILVSQSIAQPSRIRDENFQRAKWHMRSWPQLQWPYTTTGAPCSLTEITHVCFQQILLLQKHTSVNTGPPSEPDDALSCKGSFPAWHTEEVRIEKGSPLHDVSVETGCKDKSSPFVCCEEDNVVSMSAGSLALLSSNSSPLPPLTTSSCKGPFFSFSFNHLDKSWA